MPTEQDHPPISTPEQLLSLERQMLEDWLRLPVAHQAALLLLLVERARSQADGEWWLQGVMRELAHSPEQRLSVPFQITSVSRMDVVQSFSLEEAAHLSDEDMRRLARKMEGEYTESGRFEDDLAFFTEEILKDKGRKPGTGG